MPEADDKRLRAWAVIQVAFQSIRSDDRELIFAWFDRLVERMSTGSDEQDFHGVLGKRREDGPALGTATAADA